MTATVRTIYVDILFARLVTFDGAVSNGEILPSHCSSVVLGTAFYDNRVLVTRQEDSYRWLRGLWWFRGSHLFRHVQVVHHGGQPVPFLLQLNLQLRDHLHLNPGLRRRSVVQRVLRVQVPVGIVRNVSHFARRWLKLIKFSFLPNSLVTMHDNENLYLTTVNLNYNAKEFEWSSLNASS